MEDREKLHRAYLRVFGSLDGDKVLEDIERQGFFRESLISGDASLLAYNEGRRSMVLHIKRMLEEDAYRDRRTPTSQDETTGGRAMS